MRTGRARVACAALAGLLAPGAIFASGDSLCVRFAAGAGGETILIARGYSLSGELPVVFCGVERGAAYRLELGGAGFERRLGSFRVEAGGASVGGIRLGAMARNALLPGWGAAHAGRAAAGAMDIASIASGLAFFAGERREYDHLRNRHDISRTLFETAESYEDALRAGEALHEAAVAANVQNAHCRRLALLCGALYGWQAVEPLFADPPPRAASGPDGGSIVLTGSKISIPKAFVFSLLRPGRGQFYQGKNLRGVLISAASAAAGFAVLEYWNRYDEAVSKYDLRVEEFEASESVPERETIARSCALLYSEVEGARQNRSIAIGVLAGIWGWSCADVFFDGGGAGSPRYSLAVDPRGAAVAVRF